MDVLFRTSSWTSSSTGDGEYQRGVHCAQICTLESLCRGHNELDEPAFTQPLMYQKIRSRKSVPVQYEEKLLVRLTLPPFLPPSRACPHSSLRPELPRSQTENLISKEDVSALRTSYKSHLDEHLAQADAYKRSTAALFQGQWKGIVWPASEDAVRDPDTGYEEEELKVIGRASVGVPEDFVRRVPVWRVWSLIQVMLALEDDPHLCRSREAVSPLAPATAATREAPSRRVGGWHWLELGYRGGLSSLSL